MSTDFLNKNDNAIEQQIGMPLEKYSFADLKFDTGDITVDFFESIPNIPTKWLMIVFGAWSIPRSEHSA